MTRVEPWVQRLTEDVMGGAPVEIGKRYMHPTDGLIEVVSGQYWGTNGLSNHWRWKVVKSGEIKAGYGGQWYEVETVEEARFLVEYDPSKFPITVVTVDTVVAQWVKDASLPLGGEWMVVLIKRGNWPYKGFWALPGGFIDPDEPALDAARREVKEEAGLDLLQLDFKHVADRPDRDPRGRAISMVYLAQAQGIPFAGDDAVEAEWFPYSKVKDMTLAFDHAEILERVL